MIKVLIARLATIGLAYTVANAVKAGTGLTDDHQDGNDDDDDGDEDGSDEDEMKFSPFFILALPLHVWQKVKLLQIFLTFS